ncbi:MAG: BON domain-containing protein [Hyphomonadaceae bacterium]
MRIVLALAAVSACALSSGCVTAAVGTAAGVGLFAVQDRTIGEGIDDAAASQQIKTRLLTVDRPGFAEVDVEVANGNVLLSGPAPSEQHRHTAELIARNVGSISNVYNEIVVGPHSSFLRSTSDELITAQVRARLAASGAVRAINVNIETFQGNVYLMGLARSQSELERAAEIASRVRGVQRVVSFMEVRPITTAGYVEAPPAPQFRAAEDDGAAYGDPFASPPPQGAPLAQADPAY